MRFTLTSRIAAAFVVSLISLVALATISYRNVAALNRDAERVVHTYEVLETKERLERTLANIEAAARAYVLALDPAFRADVDTERAVIAGEQRTLRTLTADNASQQERIDQLDTLLQQRGAAIDEMIGLRDRGVGAADQRITDVVRAGSSLGRQIRQITNAIEAEERGLLGERSATTARAERLTEATLLYGSVASTVLMLAIVVWLLSSLRGPLRSLVAGAGQLARGEYGHRVTHVSRDEIGDLAMAFNEMAAQIEQRQVALAAESWVKNSQARLSRVLAGQRDLRELCDAVLSELAQLFEVQHGAIYLPSTEGDRD
jgi:methyl-accepting chemotaxis protein